MQSPVRTAVILAVGSELTTGTTRDTNSGQLAGELSGLGVEVLYAVALPDRLERVSDAFRAAIAAADLVVSTGGLGPTPDDLTREAIAAATGLPLTVDAELERWLRALFRRRRVAMPESNLKQAWLVPGASGLRNGNGTAPGWWLDLDAGTIVVALPGPPREMWPMWQQQVLPRLAERGVGAEVAVETLRLSGIGESALVELIGEDVLRNPEPEVATYARPDAVDLRVTAHGDAAEARAAATVEQLIARVGQYVFARGAEGWPEVIGGLLGGRTLAIVEVGTGAQLAALLGGEAWLAGAELVGRESVAPQLNVPAGLADLAARVREWASADIGLAVVATPGSVDTRVELAIATADERHTESRTAFLGGAEGQRRSALAACTTLWQWLREHPA
jgi:nicotinamide-nucleotide amidase